MSGGKRILWGVCGIGHGHTFRQKPLIDHFAAANNIVIFAYGESLDVLARHYAGYDNVEVVEVAVPYYVGGQNGIDYAATAAHPANGKDFARINAQAMDAAARRIGRADLVVTDYEPVSAQYAYAKGIPLVTVDQQSKYLAGKFASELHGTNSLDEQERLRLFFPQADLRLASSFFDVDMRDNAREDVTLCPPVLGEDITTLKRHPDPSGKTLLMYVSAQQQAGQGIADIAAVCAAHPDVDFHLFGKAPPAIALANVKTYRHGDPAFFDVLARCNGIVSTAGHTLLSEAMHLGIPVYAIPLKIYEQQMNAAVIDYHGFGIARESFNAADLGLFLQHLPTYAARISTDERVLLRGPGQADIITRLERRLTR